MGRLRHTSRAEGHYLLGYSEAIPKGYLCTNFAHIVAMGAVTLVLPYFCLMIHPLSVVRLMCERHFVSAFAVVDDANIRRLFIFVNTFYKLFLNFFYCNIYCIDIQ